MKYSPLIVLLLPLAAFVPAKKPKFHAIPASEKKLSELIAEPGNDKLIKVPAFEVGELVTLGEYKIYLECMRRDSSEAFYVSQLPDSAIGTVERYTEYLIGKQYEKLPVVGVSWDNAMNYCRWLTVRENPDSIAFIYRLPDALEWLGAREHLRSNGIQHDFDGNYSDWTLTDKDESMEQNGLWSWTLFTWPNAKEPPALRRKTVLGNSYRFQRKDDPKAAYSYYSDKGYRTIGFRCLKEKVSTKAQLPGRTNRIIEHWKL